MLPDTNENRRKRFSNCIHLKDTYIHLAAVGIAGIYGISQEYKLHNIGGNNVFDIYDVIASIIGLMIAFGLIQKFGFIDKTDLKND